MIYLVLIGGGFSVVFAIILLFVQHGLIYFPRPYEQADLKWAHANTTVLEFQTSEGTQTAFYIGPDRAPERLWVLFHGNASLALDWAELLQDEAVGDTGFLLVDFPGCGASEGRASAKGVAESGDAAMAVLAESLGMDESRLEENLGAMGFSLGAAAALQFAETRPVDRVVLLAPFTSLRAMARRTVPFPFYYLLLENYDNEGRLKTLVAREEPPKIFIFHGSADDVIPVEMSRQMAQQSGSGVVYTEVANHGHNDLVDVVWPEILAIYADWADEANSSEANVTHAEVLSGTD
jgi:alpha-beta hydrolase superfamily lysophospholipase